MLLFSADYSPLYFRNAAAKPLLVYREVSVFASFFRFAYFSPRSFLSLDKIGGYFHV
ncbi:hypothetical protein CLOSTMETH_01465 [[Clostridium] methylpentosum DSM 5476]|uniref:Uncharacterized protein n=1 Tax=[Clostridium] methylpentosum DSM 5476 TaxID=537013 RepID=C0EC96_9FIRM|nr:hypothetical protein CLOSTMETH_01465 [[Clostridium] methylpentosum DSM 5476]